MDSTWRNRASASWHWMGHLIHCANALLLTTWLLSMVGVSFSARGSLYSACYVQRGWSPFDVPPKRWMNLILWCRPERSVTSLMPFNTVHFAHLIVFKHTLIILLLLILLILFLAFLPIIIQHNTSKCRPQDKYSAAHHACRLVKMAAIWCRAESSLPLLGHQMAASSTV